MSFYTIEKIAKKIGVSPSSISRVINNKDNVSKETRIKIEEALIKYNYIPNLNARRLKGDSKLIGVVFPDITNPYFTEVILGIESILRKYGFITFYLNTNDSLQEEEECIYKLLSVRVQGVILISNLSDESNKMIETAKNNTTIVSIENEIKDIDNIIIDNEKGVERALNIFYEKGHRKIGFCSRNLKYSSWEKRYNTYMKFVSEKNILNKEYIYIDENFIKKIDKNNLPTAIFTTTDVNALEIYKWCEKNGIKIYKDLSVIGFDGIEIGNILQPKLTTIVQPAFELGKIAAETLVERIEKKEKLYLKKIFVEPKLKEGNSVRNIKK